MERKRIPYSEENTWFTITISNSMFGSYNFMDVYIYQKGPLSWAIKKARRTKPKRSGRNPRSKTKPQSRNGTSSHPGLLRPVVVGSNVELLLFSWNGFPPFPRSIRAIDLRHWNGCCDPSRCVRSPFMPIIQSYRLLGINICLWMALFTGGFQIFQELSVRWNEEPSFLAHDNRRYLQSLHELVEFRISIIGVGIDLNCFGIGLALDLLSRPVSFWLDSLELSLLLAPDFRTLPVALRTVF